MCLFGGLQCYGVKSADGGITFESLIYFGWISMIFRNVSDDTDIEMNWVKKSILK